MINFLRKITPSFILSFYHFCLSFLAAVIYRFPSRQIKVIAVTGTNGKTTVVSLVSTILKEAGFKVASFSSVSFVIGDKEEKNLLKMTMPGRFKVQKMLRQAVEEKCQYAVLEVTSEGIKQYRHKFINFEVAVFTNLTPEHIESHGGFENYKKAKGKLFKATKKVHIVNVDDENADYFLSFPAKKKYTFGQEKGDVNARNTDFQLPLIGEFNVYNALAAICVAFSQEISLKVCQKALKKAQQIPGRMEEVISFPFKVFVDYAFTPNALEKVYQTLKPKKGKLIAVLGACGGGRDKWKRKVLGSIAASFADKIIITNEDPYDEDPMRIIKDVSEGTKGKAEEILNRREAINIALSLASPGDVVIVTGKGSEPWIVEARGEKIPWDDRKVVKEEYEKIKEGF